MNLVDLREAVRQQLADAVGPKITVQTFGGRFDLAELKRWGARAPCLLVAAMGLPRLELEGGTWNADVRWAVFVLTKDLPQRPRDATALDLVEATLVVIRPEEDWGDPDGQAVRDVAAENLYSGQIDTNGVALWVVTWRQRHDLPPPKDAQLANLADFLTYDVKYNLAEGTAQTEPQAEDKVTLEGA